MHSGHPERSPEGMQSRVQPIHSWESAPLWDDRSLDSVRLRHTSLGMTGFERSLPGFERSLPYRAVHHLAEFLNRFLSS